MLEERTDNRLSEEPLSPLKEQAASREHTEEGEKEQRIAAMLQAAREKIGDVTPGNIQEIPEETQRAIARYAGLLDAMEWKRSEIKAALEHLNLTTKNVFRLQFNYEVLTPEEAEELMYLIQNIEIPEYVPGQVRGHLERQQQLFCLRMRFLLKLNNKKSELYDFEKKHRLHMRYWKRVHGVQPFPVVDQEKIAAKQNGHKNFAAPRQTAPSLAEGASLHAPRLTSRTFGESGPMQKEMLYGCQAMEKVWERIEAIANEDRDVLIQGERGTGKELVAHAIHWQSNRREKPILSINCAACPESLLESQLFGHRKGTFTDAKQDQPGLCENVGMGTLFLDEIGEFPPSLQAKLLRLLQERKFRRIGDTNGEQTFHGRIVAATNQPLVEQIEQEKFRADFFDRLGFPIKAPSLRERGDKHQLTLHILRQQQPPLPLSQDAWGAIEDYAFPGNIRELTKVIEHAHLLANHRGDPEISRELIEEFQLYRNP